MKKAAVWVISLSAFIPLMISLNLVTNAIGGKTTLVRALAFGGIALITLAVFFSKKKEMRTAILERIMATGKNPLFVGIMATILAIALSVLFAYDKSTAFFGEPFRAEGFLTLFAFFILSFCMITVFGKKEWDRYFLLTLFTTIVMFAIEARQAILGMVRPDSLAGNPTFLSAYYLFSLFAAGYVYLKGRNENNTSLKYLSLATLAVTIIGIFLTKTRGTILALAASFIICSAVAFIRGEKIPFAKKTVRFFAGVTLVITLVFSGIFLSTRQAAFWQHIPGLNRLAGISLSETTVVSRIKFTQVSVTGFFKDSDTKTLFLGYGWDNYLYFFQDHYDPLIYRYEQALTDRAHNKLVDALIMSGIVGLISYLVVWFLLFKYSVRLMREKFSYGLLMIFFLTAYFINNLFSFDVAVTYLGFYSAAAFLIYTRHERI